MDPIYLAIPATIFTQVLIYFCYMKYTNRRIQRIEDQLDTIIIVRPGTAVQLGHNQPPPRFHVPPPPRYIAPLPSAPYHSPQDPMPPNGSYFSPDNINTV